MGRSSMSAFLSLWRAYGEGRLERSFELIDPACDLVTLDGGCAYRGHDGVRQWIADGRHWRSVTVTFEQVQEPHDGCVVAAGRLTRASADGSPGDDRAFACVAEFRDGRLVHGRAFADQADALGFASERDSRRVGESGAG
jgi:ketosteroid isomerase-like protein